MSVRSAFLVSALGLSGACTPENKISVAARPSEAPTPSAAANASAGSGLFPRLKTTPIEAGAACPAGGVLVETWASPLSVSSAYDSKRDKDYVAHNVCSVAGAKGSAGTKGADGVSLAFASTALPVGDVDCVLGGQKYDTWKDVNGNGTYESAVDLSYVGKKICHGLSGAASGAGANAVVITTALAAGHASCKAGGTQIEAFTDLNAEGSYQAGIDINYSSRLVCNGASALVLASALPADGSDATCRNGGTLYRSFTDVNASGAYEAGVDANLLDTKVCNGLKALAKTSAVAVNDATCPAGGTLLENCTDSDNNGQCVSGQDTGYASQKICTGTGAGLAIAAEAAGANCKNGGQRITRFSDSNGNGSMDAGAETTGATIAYACNGLNWLSKSTAFATAAGTAADNTACPAGGFRLEFGYDNVKASDGTFQAGTAGTLDAAEIVASATVHACNGAKAIVTTASRTGDNTCPAGGVTVTSCTDVNANGVCDAGEGPTATALCHAPKLLALTSAESAGANCTYSGSKLQFGFDHVCAVVSGACTATGNYHAGTTGILDTLEIDAALTRFACKGDTGAQGTGVVIAETVEAPGVNCTAGGKKLDFYQDANNNGTKDAGETTTVGAAQYVCHGLGAGYAISAEPVGANCLAGGQKILSWQDRNGNATYEAGTDGAQTTQYACNGTGGPSEPQAGPHIAQFQNDSEGDKARFYWQVASTLGAAAPTVKLAHAASRGALEAWACESSGSAPTGVTVIENYSACESAYATGTVPFATATSGVFGAQGKCGVNLGAGGLALANWQARYFKLCAVETASSTNRSLSTFRVAGRVPTGMVLVHKDEWPLTEFAGSGVTPYTFAIDKYEGYNSNAGSIDNTNACTSTSCAANTSTLIVGSAAGQTSLYNIRWDAFKKGCANRTAAGFTTAGHPSRQVHLATDMEWMVAAAGTPDIGAVNYCNTYKTWDGSYKGETSGTAATQYCKSRYGAENMIGNVWEWTDSYWDYSVTPRTRSEYFGTAAVATTPLSDATLGYTYPTSANPSVVSAWDFRFHFPTLTGTAVPTFPGDGFWLISTAQRASLRGGAWSNGAVAGRFALALNNAPSLVDVHVGGRCGLLPP
jgi:formylglycine-generating enzyme required for sulfatase activity